MVFSDGHPTYQCKSGQFKIRDYMDEITEKRKKSCYAPIKVNPVGGGGSAGKGWGFDKF